tara:strand:- start:479 stop:790 length:312 start_codon:yes stop_codon:yes gene_type:complete
MTYITFKQIIDLQIAHTNRVRAFYDLKLDLTETFEEQEKAIDLLWKELLTEFGYDWLNWYLYEKDGISGKPRPDLSAFDDNDKEICKDLQGLWKYLTKQKYFR